MTTLELCQRSIQKYQNTFNISLYIEKNFKPKSLNLCMKTTLFALLITSFLLVPFSKSYSQAVNVNDSLALVDLYNSTDGAHWTNNSGWLNGPVKSWYGINVSSDRVDQLILENNNLQGTLQSSLGKLTHLWNFDLHNNSLAGSIPSSLGNLVNLITLDLRYNLLTGTIPSSIGKLTNLSMLGFASNQ